MKEKYFLSFIPIVKIFTINDQNQHVTLVLSKDYSF